MKVKTVKQRSQKQEKAVAKALEAKVVVASGAIWSAKGDCRSEKCLIECKTTKKDFYSVTSKVWEKIEEEAIRDNDRIPLLVVDLQDKERFVVFKPSYFDKEVPCPYDNESNGEAKKSFRLSLNELEKTATFVEEPYIYGRLFIICGNKSSMLMYMRYKDFIENFKEEL